MEVNDLIKFNYKKKYYLCKNLKTHIIEGKLICRNC